MKGFFLLLGLWLALRAHLAAQESNSDGAAGEAAPTEERVETPATGQPPTPAEPFRIRMLTRERSSESSTSAEEKEPGVDPATQGKTRLRRDQPTLPELILIPIRLLSGGSAVSSGSNERSGLLNRSKSGDKEQRPAPKNAPVDYFVIRKGDAVFHEANFSTKWETEAAPLLSGVVGRSHGEGEKWAWVELDNGQVGLMLKKNLGVAHEQQIAAFLKAEEKNIIAYAAETEVEVEIASSTGSAPITATEFSDADKPIDAPPSMPATSPNLPRSVDSAPVP